MPGIARIYEHVTEAMEQQISDALEYRWLSSLRELTSDERHQLVSWIPQLAGVIDLATGDSGAAGDQIVS